MHADIIVIFLIMLPTVIIRAIPQLRDKNNVLLTALKIIPLGITVFFIADKLISRVHQWLCEWKFENLPPFHITVRAGIPFAAAILMITLCGWLIHKKAHTGKKYNPMLLLGLFLPALLMTNILFFAVSMSMLFLNKGIRDDWRAIYLPQINRDRIVFEEQPIHIFQAEYNYRLRFVSNGKTFYQLLFTNCGGKTHFNIYRLKDGRFLFRDKDWDYIVDPARQKAFRMEPEDGKLYIASVPNEEICSFGAGLMKKNGKMIMCMGGHDVPAEEVTGILDGMVYYGCIKDKFYPAAEKQEEKIIKRLYQ